MSAIKYIGIIYLFLLSISINAATPKLNNNAQAILFTCSPGQELYAGFGHSALWISDPVNNIDRLYNYGTFDFNTPNFYTKFIRGKLEYMLSVTTIGRFIREYELRGIEVHGQVLNLKQNEIDKMFSLLEENAKPENKFYKYDFFMDNCATRIRDVVVTSIDGNIDFKTSDKNVSYRELLFPYLTHTPWTRMGINLILGLSSDARATTYDYMYLPEHMQEQFGNALIQDENNERKLVTSEKKFLNNKLNFSYNILLDPAIIFTIILLLVVLLSYREIKRNKHVRSFDIALNAISVFAGIFLFFMWVGTDHAATNYNLNIFWLIPAQTIFLFTLISNKINKKMFTIVALVYQFCIAIIMYFWTQESEFTFLLLNILFIIRFLFHYKRIRIIQ
jgi:hypothetical protein